jgi:hypothetical protein
MASVLDPTGMELLVAVLVNERDAQPGVSRQFNRALEPAVSEILCKWHFSVGYFQLSHRPLLCGFDALSP